MFNCFSTPQSHLITVQHKMLGQITTTDSCGHLWILLYPLQPPTFEIKIPITFIPNL